MVVAYTPAWVFRGVANIAAGVVWYRSVKNSGPWGRITGVGFVVWGLHNFDYPFLRGVASFAAFGFMLGAFLEFVIAFGALIAHFERTRARLVESESRYRALFENSGSAMLIIDPKDGRIVHANGAAAAYYGWGVDELCAMRMSDINTLTSEEIAAAMAQATSRDRLMFDFQHRLATGEVRDVEVYSGPVVLEGKDLLYSIVHDVTDRVTVERELRESEERYSTLFEDSQSAMLLVSASDARILDANAAASRMYGLPVGQIIGMGMVELTADTPENVEREVADTVADGGRAREFRHRRSDGTVFDVEIYSTPIQADGGTVLYTIINDISRRVEAQRQLSEYQQHLEELVGQRTVALSRANLELERASRAKDAYLANMSHELRTPLNSVIGFSELLSRGMAGDLNAEQSTQIGMIHESGRHLLRVVDGILDLARIAAGEIDVSLEDVDVSKMCSALAEQIRPMIPTEQVEMRTRIEDGVAVRTDPVLLEQVLWNLLGNAVKFTEHGWIELSLESREDDVVLAVRDTGRGVAPDDQWRVFEMFVRIEDDNGERSDGTGLGLPISKRLVEVLGGTIEFTSEPGTGSEFCVLLPLSAPGSA